MSFTAIGKPKRRFDLEIMKQKLQTKLINSSWGAG